MTEIIYAAQRLTNENIADYRRKYDNVDLMRTPRNRSFMIGDYLVFRKIHIPDPFEPAMKTTLESNWLVGLGELLLNFKTDTDPRRYNDFQIIEPRNPKLK